MRLLSEPVKRKRSVFYTNTTTREPSYFLELSKKAYSEEFINEDERLEHAGVISTIYLGALRVNECLHLTKENIKFEKSNDGIEFLVLTNVEVEKRIGSKKSVPIPLTEPLVIPLVTRYYECFKDEHLFSMTRRTVLNIVFRITGREGWTHWLRSQRVSWLSSYLTPYELEAFAGWGRKKPRKAIDFYIHRQWRDYADKIARATTDYWQKATVEDELTGWLLGLSISTTPTT